MKLVYLSLGSNRGDRLAQITRALAELTRAGARVERTSRYYRTEPVDFHPQPWFVNCVAEARTELMPMRLLRACQSIERALGRRPGAPKGPRPIDIDILLYENAVIRSPELTVPHPRLEERRFVLVPLAELAPGARHPATQRSVAEMLHETRDSSRVILLREARTHAL
ncbi:MAG: 2-amino-4-hydroxy-6-hydroxymethyldihydropteridine diphosphokinase [Terriglobia bacterium]